MLPNRIRAAVLATVTSAALAAGAVIAAAAPASAATCPAVNPTTGAVTPAPMPGIDWSGCLLGAADLRNADLAGADLAGANLISAKLQNADLDGANLDSANLSAATMTAANFANASMANATVGGDMTGANLTEANLTDATVTGTLTDVTITAANFTGATLNVSSGGIVGIPAALPTNWSLAAGYLIGPGADLANANLAGAKLTGADLAQAVLTSAIMGAANLTSANLAGANLTGADLTGANLTGATLSNANLTSVDMARSDVAGTDMSNAIALSIQSGGLTGMPAALPFGFAYTDGYLLGQNADLAAANLAGANLAGLNLQFANLANANLADADLQGTELGFTDLQANLTNANLRGANLSAANLSFATLTDADLTDALLGDADLVSSQLGGAILTGADLGGAQTGPVGGTPAALPANWTQVGSYLVGPGADLAKANLSGADMAGLDLAGASLTGANLQNASLDGADVTGADFRFVVWGNTICPDGTNSDQHSPDGCTTPLNSSAPVAAPVVAAGTQGANGWYTTAVTVDWHWTASGAVNPADCPQSSTTSGEGTLTLTGTCTDLAGNVGHASYRVQVDTTAPAVTVTGVRDGARYLSGAVPVAGCDTTDNVSGVASNASVKISTSGRYGVGTVTATCGGAESVAGNSQTAPVTVSYSVGYGFGGFIAPRPGSSIAKSAHTITARFRLVTATGKPVTGRRAAAFGAAHLAEVRLSGPRIRSVTASCQWNARARYFQCVIKIPAAARTGVRSRYLITALEKLGRAAIPVPVVRKAVNPITIHFR